MKRIVVLILFIVGVIGSGLYVGYTNTPDEWYQGLVKPWFTPPSWLFAPVRTAVYLLIALAGWRVWDAALERAQRLWWAALVLNLLWSPVFFGMHMIGAALVIILLLDLVVAAFIILALRQDRSSALMFAPYMAWLVFATMLNAAIYSLN